MSSFAFLRMVLQRKIPRRVPGVQLRLRLFLKPPVLNQYVTYLLIPLLPLSRPFLPYPGGFRRIRIPPLLPSLFLRMWIKLPHKIVIGHGFWPSMSYKKYILYYLVGISRTCSSLARLRTSASPPRHFFIWLMLHSFLCYYKVTL